MIAFEIEIDGERYVVAGVEDWSILSMHITAKRAERDNVPTGEPPDVDASAGGLTLYDADRISYHFRWPRKDLAVGSSVTVKIIETSSADPPVNRYRSDREVQENPFTEEEWKQMRHDDYLKLKQEFEGGDG